MEQIKQKKKSVTQFISVYKRVSLDIRQEMYTQILWNVMSIIYGSPIIKKHLATKNDRLVTVIWL